jgi:hypothetical protein
MFRYVFWTKVSVLPEHFAMAGQPDEFLYIRRKQAANLVKESTKGGCWLEDTAA